MVLAYVLMTTLIGGILIIAQLLTPIVPEMIRQVFASVMHAHGWLWPVWQVLLISRGFPYVTMGHTHDTDFATLGANGEYYNTGTWTKVFSPEERLICEESELVFLQGVRSPSGLTCKLMKWNDGTDEPRLVKLFSDIGTEKPSKKRRARAAGA